MNFYSSDEIVAAKNALFEAAKGACTDTDIPQYHARRDLSL